MVVSVAALASHALVRGQLMCPGEVCLAPVRGLMARLVCLQLLLELSDQLQA